VVAVNQDMRNVGMTSDRLNSWDLMAFSKKPWLRLLVKMPKGFIHLRRTPKELKTGTGKTWYDSYKAKYKIEPEAYASYGYESAKVVVDAINKVCKMTAPSVMRS